MKKILAIIMSTMVGLAMLPMMAFVTETEAIDCLEVQTGSVYNKIKAISEKENRDDENCVKIRTSDIDVSWSEKNEFRELTKDVANSIFKNNSGKVERTIKSAITDSKNSEAIATINNEIRSAVESSEESNASQPKVVLTQDFCDNYEYTYTDDKVEIVLNPLYIEVSELDETPQANENEKDGRKTLASTVTNLIGNEVYAASKTKTRTCSEKKTYYSWAGMKIFTIGMECNFYYNGTKAWYKSGFDAWYTRGALSVWQVSNWKEKREKNGKSYTAWCAGNFHMGLEVKGVGLVLDDKYIKHKITCTKDGKISISRTGFQLNK